MTGPEFVEGLRSLVGPEFGFLARGARLLGASHKTVSAISQGVRPVPEALAARLRAAVAESERRGACVPFVAPRLVAVVDAGVRAGWRRDEVLSAVAAWAALALSGAARLPRRLG